MRKSVEFQPEPVDSDLVQRCMSLEKFMVLLENGLWMSRLDTFNDPLEGQRPQHAYKGILEKHPAPISEWLKREFERNQIRSYASCWQIGGNLNSPTKPLWEFGDIAVVCRTQVLADVAKTNHAKFGKVRYIDHAADLIEQENLIEASFVVRNDFEDENEARVLIFTKGRSGEKLLRKLGWLGRMVLVASGNRSIESGEHEFFGAFCNKKAAVLLVDDSIIFKVILAPESTVELRKKVTELLERKGLSDRLVLKSSERN